MIFPGNITTPRLRIESILAFSCRELEQSYLFPGEAHQALELTYVCSGTLHCIVQGEEILLRQGELALFGPGQWHMQYADIGTAPKVASLLFTLTGCDLLPLCSRVLPLDKTAAFLVTQMLAELEAADAYSLDMTAGLLSQLLLTLLRHTAAGEARIPASEHSIILRTQQYICAHSRDRLSVPLVARMVDMSPSYLTALFSKHLHISPGEYIRRVKLEESKRMIRENTWNFTEIASALQYSTVHHFSRQFKEKFGITPTEYAKSLR